MLKKIDLKSRCSSAVYLRGMELYNHGSVSEIKRRVPDEQLLELSAAVVGSTGNWYQSKLTLDVDDPENPLILDSECTCPAAALWYTMCKHCVALGLAYLESEQRPQLPSPQRQKSEKLPQTSEGLSAFLAQYRAPTANLEQGIRSGEVHLCVDLRRTSGYYDTHWEVSCKIGTSRMYVVKNLATLLYCVLCGVYFAYGKNFGFTHSYAMFDPASRRLLDVLERVVRTSCPGVNQSGYASNGQLRSLRVNNSELSAFLEQASSAQVSIHDVVCQVAEGNPALVIQMQPSTASGAELQIPTLSEIVPPPFSYYAYDGVIYHCTPEFSQQSLPFLRAVQAISDRKPTVTQYLSQNDYLSFCANVLPLLEPFFTLRLKNLDFSEYRPQKPEFQFYLSTGERQQILLRPTVSYGAAAFPLLQVGTEFRRAELEAPVRALLEPYLTAAKPCECIEIWAEALIYRLLERGLDELRQVGEVYLEDTLNALRIAPTPKANIGISLKGNLIDLEVQVDELPQDELEQLLNAYREKKKFYRLKSGDFLTLENGSLSVLSELADTLQLSGQALRHAEIPAFRAQYLNALVTGSDSDANVTRSLDFRSLIRNLRDYTDSDYELPAALHATLRNYQKTGYRWLCTLCDQGLCGILADDMGLGKTIQIITLLLHLQERTLIVCPASLLYNWESELRRFAPDASVQLIQGAATQRAEQLDASAQIYVTSYDLLKRDLANYEAHEFGCVVLDEAQYIRNAGTQAARAVKCIQAAHRIALTGTPIENRLSDLWSIFDFLMPGYLYAYPTFRAQLEAPITAGDAQASTRLQRMVAPFILRRKKADVLRELPEKVESVRYVDMTAEQRRLYLAQEQLLRQSLLQGDESAFSRNKLQYLAALTRLRQLCCTPELYLEGYHGGSGKVDACMELLEEAAANGHKTLVFSQFTTMLEALQAQTEQRGIPSLYLAGKHSKEQRRDMVSAFQTGAYMVFFISLKAGGTGLNLTAADRVIHFDPWWNFAAENQATDRTHRIGQKNTVFVTKLVAKNTVEEKILALQETKRALSDSILSGEAVLNDALSRDELLHLLQER